MYKTSRYFLYSAGIILLFTSVAKIVSALGTARILDISDPILPLSFRNVFWAIGGIEMVVGIACIFCNNIGFKSGLVAWIATAFLVYRLGLIFIHYHRPCKCLGNLTDALGISPYIANIFMRFLVIYLLIGGYATLFWYWRQRQQQLRHNAERFKDSI
jgi:hypothetical protein